MSIWAFVWFLSINYISRQSERLRLDERTALSRPGTPLRSGCACHSRDHYVTDWSRSKLPLPLLYVPVSPSLVSREASRDLWRSVSPSAEHWLWLGGWTCIQLTLLVPLCPKMYRVFGHWYDYKTFITFPTCVRHQRDSRNGWFWRARKIELHTSGAKRAETWWGGVKTWELAIGLAVASGGEGEKED